MKLTKKLISKKLSLNMNASQLDALDFLNQFISLIKNNSKKKDIKISGFGTFFMKNTAQRIGRNPKTKESYIIESRKKLNFRGSNILKKILNPWKNY